MNYEYMTSIKEMWLCYGNCQWPGPDMSWKEVCSPTIFVTRFHIKQSVMKLFYCVFVVNVSYKFEKYDSMFIYFEWLYN